ncbi:G/U mismatch-specific uracil-DNA glycosylase [Luteibacter rhizovicinus]|uniref:G/U mismatch-specific uracil-DNA glycosylase n=1 Tax=Luteibacter rhizovicinus TaxID=242606 RepID=A0A4R3YTE1_9GAMM|nr:mismatch-specific DNA-glycosylase [Luteibacter rhizovicinus]TCV94594.1 G/U mismatch-specific uracil-DNA glycosylase [Luteibacter rhizovicinus]
MRDAPILPDVLEPGLRLVFCGTAAGRRSAEAGAYYAHPGNMFWRTVFATGLTPRLLAPAEYPLMPGFGIGMTDLAKFHSGNDIDLPADAFDVAALRKKIATFAPGVLAFTSKHAAHSALGGKPAYGLQEQGFGDTRLFVLPSPSGQARRSWNADVWHDLARLVHAAG